MVAESMLKEHFFFKIKGIATPIWTRGQHGIDACSSPVRMCRNAYEKLAPGLKRLSNR